MHYDYDIIVVGGGHAGMEAAFASAHMGMKTLLCTLNIEMMSNMPCNPSIGGSAKGIVVREIDALGGMMGIGADHEYLQMKMLNTGKGPGVQCLRAQEDKKRYPRFMQNLAKNTFNLTLKETMIVGVLHDESHVYGVIEESGNEITSKAVILTTGTYMESVILRGHTITSAGPDGEKPSLGLSPYLSKMGIDLFRLKTGTPPRIQADTIDYSKAIPQYGTPGNLAFSYQTQSFLPIDKQVTCYLIYTTSKTHEIIQEHLNESAMYGGIVQGVGPRYCPSIEDKIVRFSSHPRHQLFLEPESVEMNSIYLQGFSTSMPEWVQDKMIRSLPGLDNCTILKYAYAIEYDAIKPLQFRPTLELKAWPGLYCAGQIVGTSGYEEAAGLGLMAGINAVLKIRGQEPFILRRDEAYIGVMIDDLVTKGTNEPYRLLSSRAEYRLLMRHDNADMRLSEYGHQIGLLSQERYQAFLNKKNRMENIICYLEKKTVGTTNMYVQNLLKEKGFEPLKAGITLADLLKRPSICLNDLIPLIEDFSSFEMDEETLKAVEIQVKYAGYIENEKRTAKMFLKMENMMIPEDIDYIHMDGLALEARQKLDQVRPISIGQAGRISGVNPADISILIMHIKKGVRS